MADEASSGPISQSSQVRRLLVVLVSDGAAALRFAPRPWIWTMSSRQPDFHEHPFKMHGLLK